ncbi:MAG: 16S rRNA (cytidine(1402)-2'-O)-methyltransferase [Gammaproteobacteria bacterium]|nr:16S rRNA (cytidine(1402)-2'-O)-methyltransferase [Gammaproteobacteria bacterium]
MTKIVETQGVLYIVATPIGNLADISLRALEVLKEVDLIAAEDTRHSKLLLNNYSIKTKLTALHEHNERQQLKTVLTKLKHGENIALISDAGTPLISDPGFPLVQAVKDAGIKVVPIPGACAAIAALSAAGMPTDRFIFEGFLPAKAGAREQRLQALEHEVRTMIFYLSPHRIFKVLSDMQAVFGSDREVVVARELTKKFETIKKDNIANIISWLTNDSNQQKGEFVCLVAGAVVDENALMQESERIYKILREELSHKQAVALAAKITGIKKSKLYNLMLSPDQVV